MDAGDFCQGFFASCNTCHRHSGITLFTPGDVQHSRAGELLEVRADVLAGAFAAHPVRLVKGPPPKTGPG